MNKTAQLTLPSAFSLDEEEEETCPLMLHRIKNNEENQARKGRWGVQVVKEDKRTSDRASKASSRATSCREAIDETLN